jgi:protein phosphatase
MTTARQLMPRYLWVSEGQSTSMPTDNLVEDRYHAIAPQLWRDTKPQEPPEVLLPLPSEALAYAHLYAYKLHLPQLYGFCSLNQFRREDAWKTSEPLEVLLLENIPVDNEGKLLPSLAQAWNKATALSQAYWLWQIINLWAPLSGTGVLTSLVTMDNVRVDGWRIRLCQLIPDRTTSSNKVTLSKLGDLWLKDLPHIAPEIGDRLRYLFGKMLAEKASLRDVSNFLNKLVLEESTKLPLTWEIAGGTDVGTSYKHNEDSYYPTPLELVQDPHRGKLAIICDGVAGHEGGEVASQLAVKLLKLQIQSLFENPIESEEIVSPEQMCNTIAAIIRVVNNTIAVQNQAQGREKRQRMATTMVMALQVNQRMLAPTGDTTSNEIYIAHIGDSRAYWITPDRCQLLTIDDDIAAREIKQGRDVPWRSANRPDASMLTQALGMKSGEAIQPTVQRFMAMEDGILLLCSDGLSDRNLVESSWQEHAKSILETGTPLAEAVQSWLALAHSHNGDDNISLVLMSCRVGQTHANADDSSTAAAKLGALQTIPREKEYPRERMIQSLLFLGGILGLLASGTIGLALLRPHLMDNWQQRLFPPSSQGVRGQG